jgi:hypothetical protein
MQELDNEIKRTRTEGLGSSDAKMVATVGRLGQLNETAKLRIAQMLGIEPLEDWTNKYTENGKKRECEIVEFIKNDFVLSGDITNENPCYTHRTSFDFKVFNHIDFEVVSDAYDVNWYEIKTSQDTTDKVF